MAEVVIRAENIGKRYRIVAADDNQGRYRPLHRMARRAGILGQRIARAFARPDAAPLSPSPDLIWALEDIEFAITEGESVGIIGNNGSGKSTLLKILARITEPTTGFIDVSGRIVSLLEVGTGFHQELTGRENIYLNGAMLGMKRAEIARRFDEIVAFSEIARFLETPVKHYSSGMYIRLAFAVAAHLEPDILLIDEVLAVGDVPFQKKCLGKMGDFSDSGRTVLFVSHNMAAVRSICQRGILLRQGRIVRDGPVSETIGAYIATPSDQPRTGIIDHPSRHLDGTFEALLRQVRLESLSGDPIRQVYFGQPFRVRAIYEVFEEIPDAAIEVGISDLEGDRIATATNLDDARPLYHLTPGIWEVIIEVHAKLFPRELAIDVCMHHVEKSKRTIDWVMQTVTFTALTFAQEGPDRHHDFASSTDRGYVRVASNWSPARIGVFPLPTVEDQPVTALDAREA